MSITVEIVEATLERLQSALPELAVELYPDRPETYRLNHPVGALLLGYPGSTHEAGMPLGYAGSVGSRGVPMGLVAQERTLRLECVLAVRRLWGEHGAVALLDRLRTALVGWIPPHAEAVHAGEERSLSEAAGVWWYSATYAAKTLTLEDREHVTDPILTRIQVDDDYPTAHIIRRDPETGAVITEYVDP